MKKYSVLVLIIWASLLFGQSPEIFQTLRGTVIDQQSKHPIIGATLQLQTATKILGTTTDIDGNFAIDQVPVGRHIAIINYLGYTEAVVPNILINSGKQAVLNISIKEQVMDLNEVVVRANKKEPINGMASGSVRILSIEELMRFSGGFNDPARMAQNYAGVASANDNRNDIIVRGNSPSGVLWRLEGIDIPSPNHWDVLGTSGGPISMLNANNLANSDFLSGAFPAEYANATAAVFDLKLKNGNTKKYEFLGQIGFNGFEAGVEGPLSIGKNASFIANARYSTLEVFNKLGIDFGTGSATPQYKDATFKVNVPTSKAGTFSLWGIGGQSEINFFSSRGNIYTQGSGKITSGSKTGILGLSHLYFFNTNTFSKLSLSVSKTNSLTTSSQIRDTLTGVFEPNYLSNYQQTRYGLNWAVNKKINARNRIKTGIKFDIYNLSTIDSTLLTENNWFKITDFTGTTALTSVFAQWQHQFSDKLSMQVGLQNSLFLLNNDYSIEPRFGLNYQLNAKNSFSLGIGRHSQLQPIPVYFSKERAASEADNAANKELDLIKSNHFVVGWTHQLRSNFRIKIEAYHQSLSDVAVDKTSSSFSMLNTGADFSFPNRVGLVNGGSGTNTGIEFTLEKSLNKGYYFLFTGSFFDSQYKGSDGIQRNSVFNSKYATNLLAGKEFKFSEKWILSLDTKVTFAGGRRYTAINLEQSIAEGRTVRDNANRWEAQYAPYFRTDFKIGVRNNHAKFSQMLSIDLTNITGRRNAFSKSYNAAQERITTSGQRGFFPNVLYQIVF